MPFTITVFHVKVVKQTCNLHQDQQEIHPLQHHLPALLTRCRHFIFVFLLLPVVWIYNTYLTVCLPVAAKFWFRVESTYRGKHNRKHIYDNCSKLRGQASQLEKKNIKKLKHIELLVIVTGPSGVQFSE